MEEQTQEEDQTILAGMMGTSEEGKDLLTPTVNWFDF